MEEGGEARGERGRVAKVTKSKSDDTAAFCKGRDREVTSDPGTEVTGDTR